MDTDLIADKLYKLKVIAKMLINYSLFFLEKNFPHVLDSTP